MNNLHPIVEKIRSVESWASGPYRPCNNSGYTRDPIPFEAADYIEFLENENKKLKNLVTKLEKMNGLKASFHKFPK